MERLTGIRRIIGNREYHFLLVTHLPHIRYISGFTGSNAVLLIGRNRAVFITDGRYAVQSEKEVTNCERVLAPLSNQLYDTLRDTQLIPEGAIVGFESAYTTVSALERLKNLIPAAEFRPAENLIEPMRQVKSDDELQKLRKAVQITESAFEAVLPEIRPGISESVLAAKINYQLRVCGASKESFDTIVASGVHSSMPHARPTDKRLAKNEFVILDFGAVYEGYHADMTRTVYIGTPGEQEREHYQAVREAQSQAIQAARAGMTAKELDSIARNSLKEKSLDSFFSHSLGHGIGLEIHESPILNQTNEQILPEGLVCTVEPGIYLPDRYGIRIENDVCLRNWGCQDLMSLPTELITVPA